MSGHRLCNDGMCLAGANTTQPFPGAFVRGGAGAVLNGPKAGPLPIRPVTPTRADAIFIGFGCAR